MCGKIKSRGRKKFQMIIVIKQSGEYAKNEKMAQDMTNQETKPAMS